MNDFLLAYMIAYHRKNGEVHNLLERFEMMDQAGCNFGRNFTRNVTGKLETLVKEETPNYVPKPDVNVL